MSAPINPCVIKMSSALEATVRGNASPVREETRPKPADKAAKGKAPIVNMSFYRHKQEFGTEPPFRSRKRTPMDIENERYVDSLKGRMEQEETMERRKENTTFVHKMAENFGIEIRDEDTERLRMIRRLNDEAKTEPQLEFILK